MANRAYLYSSDRPDAWALPEEDYYDSRHTIPLAWFFFYRPDDIRMVDAYFGASHWQEVKFSAEKQTALALFTARQRLLMSVVGGRVSREKVARFVETVTNRPGRFLLMDPMEVLGGISEDDLIDAERFARIVTLLGSGDEPLELIREATLPYVGDFSPDPDRSECQIIGYTYW
jgi:hypothetical protein